MRIQHNIEFKSNKQKIAFKKMSKKISGILYLQKSDALIEALKFFLDNYKHGS